ncbi:MAG: PQQ-binding-like beta-propeller repeat protein [Treponema sp.]|jgi:outer membrane protein assembly factor BamB|nr:PQQ-binding-like beta-propeller repeat protein [Treponema sp.]
MSNFKLIPWVFKPKSPAAPGAILSLLILIFAGFAGADTGETETPLPDSSGTDPIWRRALGGEVIGLPTVQAESVVVVCDGGNLKAYTREGKPLWNYFARGKLFPFVSRSREGTSYIGRTNGTLIAVNRSGRELWQRELPSPLAAPVVVGWDGRIFVPTAGALLCYTGAGYLLWRSNLENPLALEPVPDKIGGLVTVLNSGRLLQISPFGAVFFRELREVPVLVLPLKVEPTPYDQSILVVYKNGETELHDFVGYRRFPKLPGSPLAGIGRNGKAAITLTNGRVLLLSAEEEGITLLGESHIGAEEKAVLLYDERGIYVLSPSGATGFTEEGRRLWLMRLRGAAAVPALSDEGILYSGGSDWILYAYRVENRTRPQKQSFYGPAPEGTYGTGNPPPSSWADYYFRFDPVELDTQLGRIAEAIREGRVGEEEMEFTAYLMETAGLIPALSRTPPAIPQAPLRHRITAIRLLAYLGSRETIPFLADLFARETEPLVKVAAADTIGRIGIDPEGLALRAFATLISPAASGRNEQVLETVGAAIGALCRFSGPPLSEAGVRLLTILAGEEQAPGVRNQARQEIENLRRP